MWNDLLEKTKQKVSVYSFKIIFGVFWCIYIFFHFQLIFISFRTYLYRVRIQ